MSPLDRARALLEADPSVRLAYVFGSTARDDANPASDIDIGVVVDATASLVALAERLERGLGASVDLVNLQRAPPLLLFRVLREGVVVVSRSDREQAGFETRALAEYLDTEHLRAMQRSYLRERAESRLGPSR